MKVWVKQRGDSEDDAIKVTLDDDADVSDLIQEVVRLFVFEDGHRLVASQVAILAGDGRLLSNRDAVAPHVASGSFTAQPKRAVITAAAQAAAASARTGGIEGLLSPGQPQAVREGGEADGALSPARIAKAPAVHQMSKHEAPVSPVEAPFPAPLGGENVDVSSPRPRTPPPVASPSADSVAALRRQLPGMLKSRSVDYMRVLELLGLPVEVVDALCRERDAERAASPVAPLPPPLSQADVDAAPPLPPLVDYPPLAVPAVPPPPPLPPHPEPLLVPSPAPAPAPPLVHEILARYGAVAAAAAGGACPGAGPPPREPRYMSPSRGEALPLPFVTPVYHPAVSPDPAVAPPAPPLPLPLLPAGASNAHLHGYPLPQPPAVSAMFPQGHYSAEPSAVPAPGSAVPSGHVAVHSSLPCPVSQPPVPHEGLYSHPVPEHQPPPSASVPSSHHVAAALPGSSAPCSSSAGGPSHVASPHLSAVHPPSQPLPPSPYATMVKHPQSSTSHHTAPAPTAPPHTSHGYSAAGVSAPVLSGVLIPPKVHEPEVHIDIGVSHTAKAALYESAPMVAPASPPVTAPPPSVHGMPSSVALTTQKMAPSAVVHGFPPASHLQPQLHSEASGGGGALMQVASPTKTVTECPSGHEMREDAYISTVYKYEGDGPTDFRHPSGSLAHESDEGGPSDTAFAPGARSVMRSTHRVKSIADMSTAGDEYRGNAMTPTPTPMAALTLDVVVQDDSHSGAVLPPSAAGVQSHMRSQYTTDHPTGSCTVPHHEAPRHSQVGRPPSAGMYGPVSASGLGTLPGRVTSAQLDRSAAFQQLGELWDSVDAVDAPRSRPSLTQTQQPHARGEAPRSHAAAQPSMSMSVSLRSARSGPKSDGGGEAPATSSARQSWDVVSVDREETRDTTLPPDHPAFTMSRRGSHWSHKSQPQ